MGTSKDDETLRPEERSVIEKQLMAYSSRLAELEETVDGKSDMMLLKL